MGDGDGNPAGGAEGQTGPDVRRPHGGLAVAGGVQDAVGGSRGAQPTAGGGQAAQHRAGGKAVQVLPLGGGGGQCSIGNGGRVWGGARPRWCI